MEVAHVRIEGDLHISSLPAAVCIEIDEICGHILGGKVADDKHFASGGGGFWQLLAVGAAFAFGA